MKDYLGEYDAAAEADRFPLVRRWLDEEPLPFFKALRAQRPVLVTPECVLVARYNEVVDLLQMPKVMTVDLYKPKMAVSKDDEGYLMAHDDDALHYREKSIMQGMLNREDLPGIRALVSRTCRDLLTRAKRGTGRIEAIDGYTRHVPAVLVRDYFGLDEVELQDLLRWSYWNQYDAFHNQPFDLNSAELRQRINDEHTRVTDELTGYLKKLTGRKLIMLKLESLRSRFFGTVFALWKLADFLRGEKTGTPGDDVVTRILRSGFDDDIDFGRMRQAVNIGGLLIGAVETTSQAVAQVIQFLHEHPDTLADARAAAASGNEAAFDAMVWEALRFVPISPYLFRQASIDVTVARGTEWETVIPAGTNVLLLTQSAMFDDYAFNDPEKFDPNRNWYHNFNFGFGSHDCLGKYVGMVMIPEMVKHVIADPTLAPAGPIDYRETPFPASYTLAWN